MIRTQAYNRKENIGTDILCVFSDGIPYQQRFDHTRHGVKICVIKNRQSQP